MQCKTCGKPLRVSRFPDRQQIYCSRACYHKDKHPSEQKICPTCGNSFTVGISGKPRDNIFCSIACASKTRYRRGYQANEINPTDGAYIAGFLDGEGSIMLIDANHKTSPNRGIRPRVTITNTNKPVLEWIAEIAGVGAISRKTRYAARHKEGWQFYCNSESAESFLRQILPYMRVKARQAQLAIAFQERLRDPAALADRDWQIEWKAQMAALNAA